MRTRFELLGETLAAYFREYSQLFDNRPKLNHIQYLGHVWGPLGTDETSSGVLGRGGDARYNHRSWGRLTGDAWVMARVAVIPRFLKVARPGDITERDFGIGK